MTKKVSDLLVLKLENVALRQQIASMNLRSLQQQQAAIIEEMRAEVGASATALYNPQTRRFQERPEPPKPQPRKRARSAKTAAPTEVA